MNTVVILWSVCAEQLCFISKHTHLKILGGSSTGNVWHFDAAASPLPRHKRAQLEHRPHTVDVGAMGQHPAQSSIRLNSDFTTMAVSEQRRCRGGDMCVTA